MHRFVVLQPKTPAQRAGKPLCSPGSCGPSPRTACTADMLREASAPAQLLGASRLSLPGFRCLSALLTSASAPAQTARSPRLCPVMITMMQ